MADTHDREPFVLGKLPLSIFPAAAIIEGTTALVEGGLWYGVNNYEVYGGRASEHLDGALRHILRYAAGEEVDERGVSNLGLAVARLAILIDLKHRKMLNDDRPPRMHLSKLIECERRLITALIEAAHDDGVDIVRHTQLQPNPKEDARGGLPAKVRKGADRVPE